MAPQFMRGRRRTGISGPGIVRRHRDFGHRYIDRRQAGADLPVADTSHHQTEADLPVADTSRHQTEADLLVAAANTSRHQTMGANLPVMAQVTDHHRAITGGTGRLSTAEAQELPAMSVSLG